MRKLRNPILLLDGDHFKVQSEKRAYGDNKVEIIHITHKKSELTYEFYSSNYALQIDDNVQHHYTIKTKN